MRYVRYVREAAVRCDRLMIVYQLGNASGEAHHLPASLDDSTRFVMKVPFPAWLIMHGQEKLERYRW